MIEGSHEFRIDNNVVEVRIQQIGNQFELRCDGPWESARVVVVDEDELVDFYRWLGRNLGPLGESWKSVIDSDNKWPTHMDREDLKELVEVQQKVIEKLRQDMDTQKKILKDIRDSLQNIEEAVTEDVSAKGKKIAEHLSSDLKNVSDKEPVDDTFKIAKGALGDGGGALGIVKRRLVKAVTNEHSLSMNEKGRLVSALKDADSAVDAAFATNDFVNSLDQPTEEEQAETALGEARKQIRGDE